MSRPALLRPALLLTLLAAASASAQTQTPSYLMSLMAQLPEYSANGNGVRIYGTVDLGMMVSSTDKASSRWQQQSGGAYTSKLGFYASEDLGGGLKAEAKLEAGINADSGAQQASALFNRESWVGLRSTTYGTLRFGNQINAMLPLFIDPFLLVSTNSVYNWVAGGAIQGPRGVAANTDLGPGAGTIPVRVPKALTYATPRVMGFGAQAIYASNPNASSSTLEPKASTRGGVVSFTNGRLYLAASMTQSFSSPVVVATGTPAQSVRTDIPAFGALYDNGKIVLSTSYARIAPQLARSGEARIATLGAILLQDRFSWRASLVHRATDGARNFAGTPVDSSALGLMLGADYNFSARTALYARAGAVRNFGASTIILNSVALPFVAGGTAPQTGIETRTLALGLLHHF